MEALADILHSMAALKEVCSSQTQLLSRHLPDLSDSERQDLRQTSRRYQVLADHTRESAELLTGCLAAGNLPAESFRTAI